MNGGEQLKCTLHSYGKSSSKYLNVTTLLCRFARRTCVCFVREGCLLISCGEMNTEQNIFILVNAIMNETQSEYFEQES